MKVFDLQTAVPRALRSAEVELDVGVDREMHVSVHFGASIPGQRLVEFLRQLAWTLDQRGAIRARFLRRCVDG